MQLSGENSEIAHAGLLKTLAEVLQGVIFRVPRGSLFAERLPGRRDLFDHGQATLDDLRIGALIGHELERIVATRLGEGGGHVGRVERRAVGLYGAGRPGFSPRATSAFVRKV